MGLSEDIIKEVIDDLQIMYCSVVEFDDNSEFLFAVELADNMEIDRLKTALKENNLIVSFKDKMIKVPFEKFTTQKDLQKLVNCIRLCVSF